jgi:hypothetical protein
MERVFSGLVAVLSYAVPLRPLFDAGCDLRCEGGFDSQTRKLNLERLWGAFRFAVAVRNVFHSPGTTTIGIPIGIYKGLCHKVHVEKPGIRHKPHVESVTKHTWKTLVFHWVSTGLCGNVGVTKYTWNQPVVRKMTRYPRLGLRAPLQPPGLGKFRAYGTFGRHKVHVDDNE